MKLNFRQRLLATTLLVGAGMVASPAFGQTSPVTPPPPPNCPEGTVSGTAECVQAAPGAPAGQISSPDTTSGGPSSKEGPTGATTNANQGSANETIVITGSLLRRTNTETPSPVTVLSAATLEDRGINTVADAITRLPANGAGTVPQGWNTGFNFAQGAAAISLRGLTVQSTLTIFDGMRMAYYPLADDGHRNFVDANTIPDAVVDRIEILRDGASSTYGSDAIAGVVNIITKKEVRGLHLNGSYGNSQHGGGQEIRIDGTLGFGDLANDGINAYISAEWQKTDPIRANQRGYPFNTSDQSQICLSAGNCAFNGVLNGIEATGDFNGLSATTVPVVRPYGNPGGAQGVYTPYADCSSQGLNSVTLNDYQQRGNHLPVGPDVDANGVPVPHPLIYGATQCQQDIVNQYQRNQSEQERRGVFAKVTANVGDNAQFFAQGSYYQVITDAQLSPLSYSGNTAAGSGNPVGYNPFYLPVYICPVGTPYSNPTTFNCNAGTTGAQVNPYNPFSADGVTGQRARILGRYDRPRLEHVDARTYHISAGINGSFGDGWRYGLNGTASRIDLSIDDKNFLNVRNLIVAANAGLYDFLNPANNTQAQRDFIAPESKSTSNSQLAQIDATLSKDLFELPGGPLGAAVGVQIRRESIDNPSANPANLADPYARYQSINAVGAVGSRTVKSAYFEINAPFIGSNFGTPMLEVDVSGRYDKYSSGQDNFSPKVGAKFTPVREIALRGTYSKGFRIASFNEAYGLPTTGYISARVDCSQFPAFCNAHGNDPYATAPYTYGLTATGNPNLAPEKSTSYTLGAIFEPIRQLSFTVDYWNIKIKNLISGADYSGVLAQYYANNGVVNIPGITVTQAQPDINYPNALPLLGTIQYSFENANELAADGVDFGAIGRFKFGGVKWTTNLDVSYLSRYKKTFTSGAVQSYAGTLSPCDVTSCSGAPRWRGTLQNTFDFGRLKASLTSYYTSGYDMASTDYGGIEGDCLASVGASVATYDLGEPILCRGKSFTYHDLTASYDVTPSITIYGAVLNVLDNKAPYDPSAAYGLYQYNVAWAQPGFVGRFFRIGAKFDLNPAPRVVPIVEAPLPPPPPPAPATQTCPDGSVILATDACPAPPPPPPPPAPAPERGW